MQVTINIDTVNPMEGVNIKMSLQKLADNFNKENLLKIAELSEKVDANTKIKNLFNHPLFKMAL
jgi:hypothetical protein